MPHQQSEPEFSQNVSIPNETKPFNSTKTPESSIGFIEFYLNRVYNTIYLYDVLI